MDDAPLDMRLRINAVDGIREAFQTLNAGNQDVLKTPIFQLCQHAQPELRAFIFSQPHTQQLFLTFGVDAQCKEDGFANTR